MATLSSIGIGSGLDASTIISQLVALEKRPINLLQTQASSLQTTLSSFGKVQSYLDSLNSAASALKSITTWKASTATSNNAAVTATSGMGSSAGSYSVGVSQLATSQMVAAAALPSAASTLGAGTLNIDMGRWSDDSSSFTPGSGGTLAIAVAAGDTLQDIADKINQQGSAGVSASIVKDANGARLVLKSDATGADNGFRVQVSDDGGGGLSALAYDPANGTNGMTRTQAGQNAKGSINGLAVESGSNTFDKVIDGVSLTFGAVTTSPATVTVSNDTGAMSGAVKSFVGAYNALMGYLRDQTQYVEGSTTKNLQGDRTALGLQQQLRSLVSSTFGSSGAFARAIDLGMDVQKDSTIKLDESKLGAALAGNPGEVAKFFSGDGAGDAQDGLAVRLSTLAGVWLGADGSLTSRQNGLQKQIDGNHKRQDAMQTRVDAFQARLQAQYTALDARMASLTGLQNYITQQVASWSAKSP